MQEANKQNLNKESKTTRLKKISQIQDSAAQFKLDILEGLSKEPKQLSSKYFYDDKGSKLFEEITDLEEYYLTACEFEIFETHKSKIANHLKNKHFNLIELGAGDGRKTKVLLKEFLDQKLQFRYMPVDISSFALEGLIGSLTEEFPELDSEGLQGEYFQALNWLKDHDSSQNLVMFLGSNIGNFTKENAVKFLRALWASLNDGDLLLIGMDLKKDIDVMLHAYNDSKGLTKQFNLNLLERINRELDGNFDLNKFEHFETYNVVSGAMESYLVSKEKQSVRISELDKSFDFKAFEPIHLEYSHKYLESDIESFAENAGFQVLESFKDSKGYFADSLWQVKK